MTLQNDIRRDADACNLDIQTATLVIERTLIREPALEFDRDYTLEEILGKVFWATCEYVGRRIGKFFARMVRHGCLPFRLSRIRSDGHRMYRRT